MSTLIIATDVDLLDSFFASFNPVALEGRTIVVDAPTCPSWGDAVHYRDMSRFVSAGLRVTSVFFVGAPPIRTLRQTVFAVADYGVQALYVYVGGVLQPLHQYLRARRRRRRKICLIYPGKLLPVRNGSSARALDLLLSMAVLHEVLLVVPNAGVRPSLALTLLRKLGVTVYTNAPPSFSAWSAGIASRLVRLTRGSDDFTPISVRAAACRLATATAEAVNRWSPEIVVFSYAWTVDERIRAPRRVLDTHDVIVERSSSILGSKLIDRLMLRREAHAELRRLEAVDVAIAISRKDKAALDRMGAPSRRVLLSPTFGWVTRRAPAPAARPRIGFIGGRMAANRDALRLVVEHLREIDYFSHGGLLVVAGDIGKFMKDAPSGVICLGRLPTPEALYDLIDVVYAPILVAGGLNFKIFEALAAGRPVVTNRLGAEEFSLRPPKGVVRVADSPAELAAALAELLG